MKDEIIFRKAKPEDAESLVEFNLAMAFETEGLKLDEDVLAKGVRAVFEDERRGFYLVAESGGKILGGLMITYEWSDWRNGRFWWIQSVYIRPEGRGKRIYSRLYETAKELAAEAGNVCGFRLYVEKDNSVAHRVYDAVGMELTDYLMYEAVERTK